MFNSPQELGSFVQNDFENKMPYPEFRGTYLMPALANIFDNSLVGTDKSLLVIISDGVAVDKEHTLEYLRKQSSKCFQQGTTLSTFVIGAGSIGGEHDTAEVRSAYVAHASRMTSQRFAGCLACSSSTMSGSSSECDMTYLVSLASSTRTPNGSSCYCGAYKDYTALKKSLDDFFKGEEDTLLKLYVQNAHSRNYFEARTYQYNILFSFLRARIGNPELNALEYNCDGVKVFVHLDKSGNIFVTNEAGLKRHYLYGIPSSLAMVKASEGSPFFLRREGWPALRF